MPKTVEPQVFVIAKTELDRNEIRAWLDSLGANRFEIPSNASPGALLAMLAGKRCYMSYQPGLNPNVSKVRDDMTAFIDNILSVGHGSVIEHISYTLAIEDVSRVFTAEFNRHRAGMAVSEGSMRYIGFEELAYWIPPSIQTQSWDDFCKVEGLDPLDGNDEDPYMQMCYTGHLEYYNNLEERKRKTQAIFDNAFRQMEDNYKALLDIWQFESLKDFKEKKKLTSLFRRIIGMGVSTGGVWTGNLRALRHIFTMRCDPAAEEEICYVACLMLQRMMEAEPEIFGDFHLVDGYWKPKYRKV